MTRQQLLRTVAALALTMAAIFLAGCGGAAATPKIAPQTSMPMVVSVADAAAMRDAGAFVLDVREPNEYVAGHIPGATLIPLGQLASRVGEVPRNRTILVVCHSGNRSAQGRDILRAAGYPTATSMAGGMTDWAAAGMPVVTGS